MPPARASMLAAALAIGLLGCPKATPYTCEGDGDCSLGGSPGICLGSGSCGYPDVDCESGFAYAPGSPGGLASECVPVAGVPDSASATESTGSSSSESASSDDSGTTGTTTPTSSGSTTMGSPTATSSSTLTTSPSTTNVNPSTDTGDTCAGLRDAEPDTPQDSTPEVCKALEREGRIDNADDEDWFGLSGCGELSVVTVSEQNGLELEVCVVSTCGEEPTCEAGEQVLVDPYQGCCGPAAATLVLPDSCTVGVENIFFGVRVSDASDFVCVEYDLSVNLQ